MDFCINEIIKQHPLIKIPQEISFEDNFPQIPVRQELKLALNSLNKPSSLSDKISLLEE